MNLDRLAIESEDGIEEVELEVIESLFNVELIEQNRTQAVFRNDSE